MRGADTAAMELRHVRSFLAVSEELHFGRAAARLHLAQPTLSEHLRALERSVGAELVARGPRGVGLTEAGRAFEPAARRALAELDTARTAAREIASGAAGTVRVGFNYPAGARVLPATLRLVRERHPGVRLDMRELRSGPQLDALADGRLDVAFVFGPPDGFDAPDGLVARRVLRTRLAAVVAPHHPLAGRASVTFAELAQHPCVLFDRDRSPASHDVLTTAAERAGHRLTVLDEVDDSTATAVVVQSGVAVGFASAVRAHDYAGGLCGVPLTDPEPRLDVYAVWPRGSGSPVLARFLECLAAAGPFSADRPDPAVPV
jgi:DNA-binding transcriptional LysR family regulator